MVARNIQARHFNNVLFFRKKERNQREKERERKRERERERERERPEGMRVTGRRDIARGRGRQW